MATFYLLFVVALMVLDYLLDLITELLNLRHASPELPKEFEGWFDSEKYKKSQSYLRDTTRFELFSSSVMVPLQLTFILCGGFGWMDHVARSLGGGMIATGLAFTGFLLLASYVLHLPFMLYSTFVIEERYGFNKTTMGTFVADQVKAVLLSVLIGAPMLAGLLWFFSRAGSAAWLYSWGVMTLLQVVLLYLAPVLIMPLFNKFTPIEEGLLKNEIEKYAKDQGFMIKGIFKMDGSRRSTKSNAYFTGFGRWRRIVLFDTLIEKHDVSELISILAHEVGHYRLKHIQKQIFASIGSTGLMLFILSKFIQAPGLYQAFGVETTQVGGYFPIYAGLVFFGFLYAPISIMLSLVQNIVSRKHEFQADRFAVRTHGRAEPMIVALKKLTVDNLSNLTPHPLKVFLTYSHPPVLNRIEAIRKLAGADA